MRRILLTAAIACGLCAASFSARAADKEKEVKGVLIDNNCGSKQMSKANPEEAAEGHPKSCAMKEGCAGSGFAVISGKKLIKLDDAGKVIAMGVKVGDRILFGKYSGTEFKMDGNDYLHMREDDIIGIVG